jgi:hypothetical protein
VADSTDDLDSLSSHELRQRAMRLALRHADIKFFWSLLEMIPAAEEAEGRPDKLAADVEATHTWLNDYLRPDHPTEEALRPVFIDYLRSHEK